MTKFNPSSLQCKNCGDTIKSSYPGEWVCCSCYKNDPDNKGCYIDSTQHYERIGGMPNNYTIASPECTRCGSTKDHPDPYTCPYET